MVFNLYLEVPRFTKKHLNKLLENYYTIQLNGKEKLASIENVYICFNSSFLLLNLPDYLRIIEPHQYGSHILVYECARSFAKVMWCNLDTPVCSTVI